MDVFDLFAKISLDTGDYEKGLNDAGGKTSSFADKLKSGLATAAKVGTAAITAASSAIGVLTKTSIEGYGEYEQLVGGVETLFKASADTVQGYAANAYKTAGLSANEYMETVTSFSASLLQSLEGDTAAAAEKADLAITDMADNANKMGTSMESIQNAYQGFAKQNFTMLDNLKLGYGGTKEEMQRLLEDATALSGVEYDISSYADIVDAIHVVQTELGITGTTAKEASTTIQGSISSMKAAWSNLVTGIADENADLSGLIGEMVESVVTVGENVIPRVEQILVGIGDAVGQLAPIISEKVPEIITNVLPSLLDAGVQLINGLLEGIISALPALAESAVTVVESLATAIMENLPALLEAAVGVISTLAGGISERLPDLIPTIVDMVLQIVDTLIENVDELVDAAIEIITALAEGLVNALPALLGKAPVIIAKLVTAIVENAPKLVEAALKLIVTLAKGLIQSIPELIKAIPQIVSSIVNGFGNLMSSIIDIGKNIVSGIWDGIKSMATWIKDKVSGFFGGIVDGVKGFLGINSPSRVFADIGKNMAFGMGEGWDDEYGNIKKQIEGDMNFGTARVDVEASASGRYSSMFRSGFASLAASMTQNATIVVQSVLDGEVIGETAYQYRENREKAYGV